LLRGLVNRREQERQGFVVNLATGLNSPPLRQHFEQTKDASQLAT
jgi:hypothetical protein